jgi:glucose/mannose-6-phosphate isomerase
VPLSINLSESRFRTLDKSNFLDKTLEFPGQIQQGLELGREFLSKNQPAKISDLDWCGLGGSAVAADLLKGFGFEPPALPLRIAVQRYPRESNVPRLVCSYSGNTVESLHAFESVPPTQVWLAMSSGGKLQEMAERNHVPFLKLPEGYPPRAAVGYGLGAMMAIFDKLYNLKDTARYESVCRLLAADAAAYRVLDAEKNPALALAVKLVDRTPVIYTLDGLTMPSVAFRFRAQLAENSKAWSHASDLPELAHNEVESFVHLSQLLPPPLIVFLGSWNLGRHFPDPRLGMRKLLDSMSVRHETIDASNLWPDVTGRLEAGLRTMFLLDAATVYLAVLKALDPTEIPTITQLKKASTIS